MSAARTLRAGIMPFERIKAYPSVALEPSLNYVSRATYEMQMA
ncbi:MAG TPA: hypothetical protein PLF68_17595 [Nitrospira sp.]|nr:hypothetical protein [Nitrospira sp.]